MININNYKIVKHEIDELNLQTKIKKKDTLIILKKKKIDDNKFECNLINLEKNKKLNTKMVWIYESSKLYWDKIDKYINSLIDNGNINWIKKILNSKKKNNDIIYQDDDFILLRDIIWDGKDINKLYMLAIPKNSIKRSIRDLNKEDIPLLINMKKKITDILQKKWDLKPNEVYYFFHYHPSFYYLHLHICVINHESLKTNFLRQHMLNIVIDNLKKYKNYYSKATLYFEMPMSHKIFQLCFKK